MLLPRGDNTIWLALLLGLLLPPIPLAIILLNMLLAEAGDRGDKGVVAPLAEGVRLGEEGVLVPERLEVLLLILYLKKTNIYVKITRANKWL